MVLRELGLRDEAEIFAVVRTAFAVAPWNDDWHSAEEFHAYFLDIGIPWGWGCGKARRWSPWHWAG